MSTTSPMRSDLARRGPWVRTAGVVAMATAIVGWTTPAHASPWGAPSARVLPMAASPGEPATIDGALEAGDLATARTLAKEQREADPTAANWQREAEVLEQSGESARAASAYREASKAAGDDVDAEAAASAGLDRVRATARGTVADEPVSTHRKALDEVWSPPPPPPKPEPAPAPAPIDEPSSDRIVTQWYFWVTVGAIAASAAAVTAIAIRAARDDQPDALDSLTRQPGPRGLGVLRF